VARLIDVGIDRSRAWIAMEFVRGESIDRYCAAHELAVREIVGLLVQIAGAVAAAHRMLVVHSDIKPANVLVTAEGIPKLIDFGISTALRDAGSQDAATVAAGRLFSPGYAAPEQVKAEPVTVATDVFGLGALAYRLLTGSTIYPDVRDPIGYMQAIAQRDVELPSRAPRDGKAPVDPRLLRGDLDAILCKALERDPARRYALVADLQADLELYLAQRPVRARRATLSYRAGRFMRRNRLAASLGALLLVSLGAGGVFAAWQSHREAAAREMAARRGEFLANLLTSADPRRGRRDILVADLLDKAAAELDRQLGQEPLVESSMLGLIAQTNGGLGRLPEGLAASERQIGILRASGGSSLEIGQALTTRGELLGQWGKWSDARPVLTEAVTLLRPLNAPSELCQALDTLGTVLWHLQLEKDAEAIFREEIDIESRGDRQLQQRRMFPYRALAVSLGEQGRYAESVGYGRDALALARQILPVDHPDLLAIETQYASTLVNVGRGAEAEPLYREAIAAQTRVLGADHRDTLLTEFALADDLLSLHRDAESAAMSRKVASALEKLLGADNVYALTAWLNYGTASCNLHDEQTGLAVIRKVAAARRRILPPGTWFIYSTDVSIGICLSQAHRYAQAVDTLLPAAAGLEAARGPGFRRTQQAYSLLRDAYQALGRPEVAARWAAKILPARPS
jgi:serine/threonine-protein kinase